MTAGVVSQEVTSLETRETVGSSRPRRGSRVRKHGIPKLQLAPALLLAQQQQQQQMFLRQHPPPQQQALRRETPSPPELPESVSHENAYTFKRFLVIKYDVEGNGALPPPLPGDQPPPRTPPTVPIQDVHGSSFPSPLQGHFQEQGQLQEQGEPSPSSLAFRMSVPNDETSSPTPPKRNPRRGSLHPSALHSTTATSEDHRTPFPEDDPEINRSCCFSVLFGTWRRCLVRCVESTTQRILNHPLSPSTGWITRFIAMVIIGALFLGMAILVIGGNGWFQIVSAIVLAQFVGILVHKATSLPPLLGMLVVGVFVKELGYMEYFSARHEALIYIARSWALVVLMVRTGFHLDTAGVRSLSPLMAVLAIVPPLVEFAMVATLASLVLGQPTPFALLSGVIMSAACPSILRPCFSMMGAGRAVQAVLVAVACLNDMIVTVVFGIVMSVIFAYAEDTLSYLLLHRIMGVGCGILLGFFSGLLITRVPDPHDPQVQVLRSVLLGSVGIFSMMGFARIGFLGGGPVSCIIAAWVSSWGWRKQGWGPDYRQNPVATVFDVMWRIMQPVMFCLMGADLELDKSSYTTQKLLLTIVVLFSAWLVRIVVSMLVTAYGDLSIKERLYVTLSWVPKAGVQAVQAVSLFQAALCPLALDQARYRGDTGSILGNSRDVMILVLLAVVITAPLSAALTSRRGLATVLLADHLRRSSRASQGNGVGVGVGVGGANRQLSAPTAPLP